MDLSYDQEEICEDKFNWRGGGTWRYMQNCLCTVWNAHVNSYTNWLLQIAKAWYLQENVHYWILLMALTMFWSLTWKTNWECLQSGCDIVPSDTVRLPLSSSFSMEQLPQFSIFVPFFFKCSIFDRWFSIYLRYVRLPHHSLVWCISYFYFIVVKLFICFDEWPTNGL